MGGPRRVCKWLIVAVLANPITLWVHPRVAPAPADLRLVLTIPTHHDNRYWRVDLSSATSPYARASAEAMEGARSPIVYEVYWRDIPAGEYDVVAHVGGRAGLRGSDRSFVVFR